MSGMYLKSASKSTHTQKKYIYYYLIHYGKADRPKRGPTVGQKTPPSSSKSMLQHIKGIVEVEGGHMENRYRINI